MGPHSPEMLPETLICVKKITTKDFFPSTASESPILPPQIDLQIY